MSCIRYFAIGHSYLLHGPFKGWQTTGAWGMAASEEKNDYFHKFISMLEDGYQTEVKAIARNYATYERICVGGAIKEDYASSSEYSEIKDTIERFKPNIITIGLGGGNTVANDEESLFLFFDTLYEMIASAKLENTAVLCLILHENVARPLTRAAKKYGFTPVNFEYLHERSGYDNPYYAFNNYPEYDEVAARGGVEFRTHPGDLGHEAIARDLYSGIKGLGDSYLPIDELVDYEYEPLLMTSRFSSFEIVTSPKMALNYNGFNVRQSGTCIVLGSAPRTGASVSADELAISGADKFITEIAVDGASSLKLTVSAEGKNYTFSLELSGDELHTYEFSLEEVDGEINSFILAPDSDECVIKIKSIKIV